MARNQTKEAINGSKKAINELFTKVDKCEVIPFCVVRVWFLSWCAAAAAPLSQIKAIKAKAANSELMVQVCDRSATAANGAGAPQQT